MHCISLEFILDLQVHACLFARLSIKQIVLDLHGEIASDYMANIDIYRANIDTLVASPANQIILSLSAHLTATYITELETHANINAALLNPRKQIRNLEREFREYMLNVYFRAIVNKQVWSDGVRLHMATAPVTDIRPLTCRVSLLDASFISRRFARFLSPTNLLRLNLIGPSVVLSS